MHPQLQRAQMLLSQGRTEMAETELRQVLVTDPNDAFAHTLLAACLLDQKQYDEATEEAGQAIHLSPDEAFAHYMMGQVMYHRNRFDEAQQAAESAIALDPYDPDYFALMAAIAMERYQWQEALDAAEQGLDAEPDHVRCVNLRAMALTKLGRGREAEQSMDVALQNAPENAYSHANKGWTHLHQGRPKDAMVHFREALRLEPDLEFARAGIVEAMKARNPIYRWLLAFFLWLSSFSPRVQMLLVLGVVFGQRVLASVAESVPALQPLLPLIVFGYLGFVWMTWCGPMLFNLILRFDRFGRLVLSDKERLQSSIVGVYLLVALGWVVAAIVSAEPTMAIMGFPFALALIPLNGTFAASDNGGLFWIMVAVTAASTWFAIQSCIPGVGTVDSFWNSIMISLYSTWASLLLIGSSRPKKI